jgi:ketosteroid isomerase-like protein
MGPEERGILTSLDNLVQSDAIRARIEPIVEHVQRKLSQDHEAVMAWEPISLSIYGDSLTAFIRSSWVFILRARATTGAERHPNSHQRMMSFRGAGDMRTGGDGRWQSNPLISDRGAELGQRWVSIPENVWHQAVVPDADWVVVSFHTVPAEELIEERPDAAESPRTQQRRYLDPGCQSSPGMDTTERHVQVPGRGEVADVLERAHRYFNALETGATGEALAAFYAPEVVQEQFPNRLVPEGVRRDLAGILEAAARGRQVMAAQRYEILQAVADGPRVAIEFRWVGTLAKPFGSLPAGGQMRGRFAVFLEFREGRIVAQRNYDCFEAW